MLKKGPLAFIVVSLLIILCSVYPVDAYITRPGSAYALEPLVHVSNGDTDDAGKMSLMTIAIGKATPITYAWTKLTNEEHLLKSEQVRSPHENDQEYSLRQKKLMSDSQINAKIVAYQFANKPYTIQSKGVFVLNIIEGGAAEGLIEPGDQITAVDSIEHISQEQLVDYLKMKQVGDKVKFTLKRGDEKLVETIALKPIPGDESRAGLGITFSEIRSVDTTPPVRIEANDIGGPSAGLMFTLEILDQLLDEDLTKGYNVAGTGEMYPDGTVGRIGGIDLKVKAASDAGVEIFFAPDDEIPQEVLDRNPGLHSNYVDAVKAAKKLGTKMKIVPVKRIDDAVSYLRQLNEK